MSPAGEYEILCTPEAPESTLRVEFTAPLCASHSLMIWSWLPLASMVPSGLHVTVSTQFECPLRVDWHSKVPAETSDQMRTVLSQLPVASLVPSVFHATDVTPRECPFTGQVVLAM